MDEQENMHDRPGDFALDEPLPLGAAEPVDVVQVRADDALIAALSAKRDLHVDDPIDERLAGLLRAWREDVHAEPERPMDVTAAMAAMVPAQPALRRNWPGTFGPLATAAALLVIAFVGLGLAARGAEPGDALWGMTKVLYSDKAKSVEAKVTVTKKLDEARQALQEGNTKAALSALLQARSQLPVVAPEDGKQQLASETAALEAKVLGTPPSTQSTASASASLTTTTTAAPATTTTQQPVPPPPTATQPTSEPPPPVTTTPDPTTPDPTTTEPGAGQSAPGEANPSPKAGEVPPAGGGPDPSSGSSSGPPEG